MSLSTPALMREEANLPDQIKDGKLSPHIINAETEIRKLISQLESLVIDFAYLDDNATFTQDDGDSYRFTYEQIKSLADGYLDVTDTDYVALITNINTALVANGQDALTDLDKINLRQAGADFRKAETLLALSSYAMVGGLRPTHEGGFINSIQFGSGTAGLLNYDTVKQIATDFRRKALMTLFPWTKDNDADYFQHPDFNLSAIPETSYKSSNPRESYGGGSD
jgi:hypothetical protein